MTGWKTPPVRFLLSVDAPIDWPVPARAADGSYGFDLPMLRGFIIDSHSRKLMYTGWHSEIAEGWEGQIRVCPILASKGIIMANGPVTIDSKYRGELKITLYNTNDITVDIGVGERIAQLVISPVARAEISVVSALSPTPRGEGGFGSTGDK
jgi:dUTP pyrophosphatase